MNIEIFSCNEGKNSVYKLIIFEAYTFSVKCKNLTLYITDFVLSKIKVSISIKIP